MDLLAAPAHGGDEHDERALDIPFARAKEAEEKGVGMVGFNHSPECGAKFGRREFLEGSVEFLTLAIFVTVFSCSCSWSGWWDGFSGVRVGRRVIAMFLVVAEEGHAFLGGCFLARFGESESVLGSLMVGLAKDILGTVELRFESFTPNVLRVISQKSRSLSSCSGVRFPRWPGGMGISEYDGVRGSAVVDENEMSSLMKGGEGAEVGVWE